MTQVIITIISPKDGTLGEFFSQFEEDNQPAAMFAVPGLDQFPNHSDLAEKIKATNGDMIDSAHVAYQKITIGFQRNRRLAASGQSENHPFYCIISITTNDQNRPDPDELISTRAKIHQFFSEKSLLPVDSIGNTELVEPQQALLGAIQSAAAGQIARTNEFFKTLVEEFDDRRQTLEQTYASKQQDLDRLFEEQKLRLTNEELRLRERERELDDRNNTHARRAIRRELIEAVKERQQNFDISKDMRWLRFPIHVIFALLVFGTFGGAASSITALSSGLGAAGVTKIDATNPYFIAVLLKSLIFTASFLTSAGLYISWMNKWFDKHAEAQFHTKQFEFDINRASWAVEAALEWKTSQNEEMPDALLIGITRNLFDARTNDSSSYAPIDALASSILGSASNLKLNVGGSELSFDRKGIKEISKKEELG